ncbi:TetR family transcriptional regulator [Algoriphagus ratkowskyi]|uniref:TetR family transcriptional regulator n=1 Tax=Algoriphagus ratkowskyi TaxID=57028 RepID=A0A2W7RLF2_9BACT|nr:TetR/AcrR family transcriptional regulator [Algoriphagus ratkowskyi]PZX55409.1 TetR family transcriptional regulator [Algoriphagus ratkowskyi]TXD79667.1 TetR/AcrR family transcriptional regulator [Algoriphagus ratkowskyi]
MAGEKNKEKLILDSAVALFTSRGYLATRMEDVAMSAGISKGLTYFYYKNKEDLFMALTKKAFDQFKDEFRDVYRSKGKSGLEMISDLMVKIVAFAKANQVYYDSILNFLDLLKKYNNPETRKLIDPKTLESTHFQKLLEIHHEPAKIGIMMVSQGIKDGSIRAELHAEITFYTIWSMIIGYEKMLGPIEFEGKDFKLHAENWELGFLRLMQEMLKGTLQATKKTTVQGSLF